MRYIQQAGPNLAPLRISTEPFFGVVRWVNSRTLGPANLRCFWSTFCEGGSETTEKRRKYGTAEIPRRASHAPIFRWKSGTAESRTQVLRTPCVEDTTTPRSRRWNDARPPVKGFVSIPAWLPIARTAGGGDRTDTSRLKVQIPVAAHSHRDLTSHAERHAIERRRRFAPLQSGVAGSPLSPTIYRPSQTSTRSKVTTSPRSASGSPASRPRQTAAPSGV